MPTEAATMDHDEKLIAQMRAAGAVMNLQGKESGPLLMRVADRLSALKAANGELARDLRKALAARASHENAWRQEQEARLAALAARDRMAAALREIDTLDRESTHRVLTADAAVTLGLRMGAIARAALSQEPTQ